MASQSEIIVGLANKHYAGDLRKAAVHHIYGESVIVAGGGEIPSGHDMSLVDKAVAKVKADTRPKPATKKTPAAKTKAAQSVKAPVRKPSQRKATKKTPAAKTRKR